MPISTKTSWKILDEMTQFCYKESFTDSNQALNTTLSTGGFKFQATLSGTLETSTSLLAWTSQLCPSPKEQLKMSVRLKLTLEVSSRENTFKKMRKNYSSICLKCSWEMTTRKFINLEMKSTTPKAQAESEITDLLTLLRLDHWITHLQLNLVKDTTQCRSSRSFI